MKIRTQLWLDRYVGTWICCLLSLFTSRRRAPVDGTIPRKLLVILLSEMGSLVLAKPMFARLRELRPDVEIHVLLFEQNREILETVIDLPEENILTVPNMDLVSFVRDSFEVLKRMRNAKIEAVIDCELFSRISSIYSRLSGAAIRVGFERYTQEGLYRGGYINRPVLYSPHVHISHQFITLVEALTSPACPTAKRAVPDGLPDLEPMQVDDAAVDAAKVKLKKDFPSIAGKRLVLVYPGGGALPIRAWPRENFAELCRRLCDTGCAVGVIGMAADRGLAARIVSHCNNARCVDLTGYTDTLRELLLIFHFASLIVTNDGGPGHFASLTPIRAIILYGPETPTLYGSLSPRAENVYRPVSCSPCLTAYNFRMSPCDGDNLCLKQITVDEVLEKARAVLGQPPA
ncbi:glycosyltransferase family 9 protein [Verrucomicrobiota bacterium]